MHSDLASSHHKHSTGHAKTYQLLLNQSAVRYETMSPRRHKDNMFTEDFPDFIGEERNCRPIGGAKLLNRLKLNFETKARKGSKNKMKNQDTKQLYPVKNERNIRLTTEPNQPLYRDARETKLRVHSSIEAGQQTLKQHKVYSKGELKPCRLKIKTQRDGLWKATERQRKNYLDKTALLGQIRFKKPLVDHSGQKYFEYSLRDRWKDDLRLPQFVYQFKKNDQFSSEKSIQNIKKMYPNLLERKRMALQGRGIEKE